VQQEHGVAAAPKNARGEAGLPGCARSGGGGPFRLFRDRSRAVRRERAVVGAEEYVLQSIVVKAACVALMPQHEPHSRVGATKNGYKQKPAYQFFQLLGFVVLEHSGFIKASF
jgi:hypothetical protein